jgi:hypothetical protein
MLQKMVINKIVDLISRQFKLHDIMKYVKEPNEADARIDELEIRFFQIGRKVDELLRNSHPKREFVRCEKCNKEIEEK